MKRLYTAIILPFFGYNVFAQCVPVSSNCNVYWIQSVSSVGGTTQNIINTNSGCPGTASNYTYYWNMGVSKMPGESFTLYLKSGTGACYFAVWIDYNGNGSFYDTGESVFNSASATTNTVTVTVNVPWTANYALYGSYMRVRASGTALTDPCNSISTGETEDYLLTYPESISELVYDNSAMKIFPNPFSDKTILEISNNIILKDPELIITDITGKTIEKIPITSYSSEIDKGNLSRGFFFYQVRNGNDLFATGKLIIQ